jgi:Tol biopolymer transport system component/DNA-binding winged helix-turn-helix (wHTH) protein
VAAADQFLTSDGKPASPIARFGIFQLNRRTGELFRNGVRVKVQEQPMQVLLMLLEQNGEIVTREDIRQRLWPVDTFVEFDHSVNTAIKKLRQTLNDDADNPRFIETVPKKGYRFIAPVHDGMAEVPSPPIPIAEGEPSPARDDTRRFRIVGLLIAACAVVALLIGGGWLIIRSSPQQTRTGLEITPFTTYPGFEDQASLSPDGQKVAFVWSRPDEKTGTPDGPHIYVKQVGIDQPVQLTKGNDLEISPAWSPDGNSLAFVRCPINVGIGTRCGLYVGSALGGGDRLLTTIDSGIDFAAGFSSEVSWAPDGKTLAYVDRSQDNTAAIFLLDLASLQARQLTSPKPPLVGDSSPAYSPDGREIAFARSGKEVSDVWVVKTAGGEPERLSNVNQLCSPGVAWVADGKSLVFGGLALYRVSRKGGSPEILSSSGLFGNPTIRGNRLVYTQYHWNKGIWKIDLDANGNAVGKPQKTLQSTRDQAGPSYSPDGKRIVFDSQRSGFNEVWRSDADGSNLLQLTNFHGPLSGTASFSPDGSTVLLDSRVDGNAHLFTVSAEGGPVHQITSGKSDEVMPSYSHDGRWIYFPSNRGGTWNVWKMPASGGEALQVTKEGGFRAFESEDGRYLYYAKGQSVQGIWRVPVDGGKEEQVIDMPPAGLNGHFALHRNRLYFVNSPVDLRSKELKLGVFDIATGKTRVVSALNVPPAFGSPGLAVSPDGKQVLIVAQENSGAELQIVENFH